jgi:hypothetical protein
MMKRLDRPLILQEHRRRPHADAFADLTPIEESTVDDDEIDWKPDPFEMRAYSVNPETPDEIIVMIKFSGSPLLQEQLRSLC